MIQSMTGYGRSQTTVDGRRLEVEIRSVNHKFCEISMRLPKPLAVIENQVKKRLQQRFARGRFDLLVTLNGTGDTTKQIQIDLALAKQYRKLLQDLKNRLKLSGEVDLGLLTNFRNILTVTEEPTGSKKVNQAFYRLLDSAVNRLERMRKREGKELAKDLTRRLQSIRKAVVLIKQRSPQVSRNYQRLLQARIRRLTDGVRLDQRRLEQEVALYATRCDVSEEITRLESHLSQFQSMIRKPDSVGRSLDFLIQEMHREINTSGSKANDVAISQQVILIKSELEKIREQVQNIE